MALAAEELKQQLFEEITNLPASRLQEVLDFVEFLSVRERQAEDSGDPLLRIAGSLSGAPLSAEEIEQELYGKDSG